MIERQIGWLLGCNTILTEFSSIHVTDIVLLLADATHSELRIRCVMLPDPVQAILLECLGRTLSQWLKGPPPPAL